MIGENPERKKVSISENGLVAVSSGGVKGAGTERVLYNTAVHEFGHFAGLHHEHRRPENRDYQLCSRDVGDVFRFDELSNAQLSGIGPKRVGSFDRLSIMNQQFPVFRYRWES